jgi:hypothetical protein
MTGAPMWRARGLRRDVRNRQTKPVPGVGRKLPSSDLRKARCAFENSGAVTSRPRPSRKTQDVHTAILIPVWM